MENLSVRPMADALKEQVNEHGFIDVGDNIEKDLPVSRAEFDTALALLKEEGYQVHHMRVQHLGTGEPQYFVVLTDSNATKKDVWDNRENIRLADFTQ